MRHKRVPSPRRRALEFIAAHPDGCTEALLAAENIPADIVETTRVWITEAGERLLAARRVGADGQEKKPRGEAEL